MGILYAWGMIPRSFTWRPVYYLPVIGFPLVTITVRTLLLVKYDAVQPFDGLHCDAAAPLLVRLAGPGIPGLILIPPTLYLAASSARHLFRTLRHVKRAQRDDTELPRQIRRERQGAAHSLKASGSMVIDQDDDVHSTSFPTFAPMNDKPLSPPDQRERNDGADGIDKDLWAPPEALELEDGTFQLSYREHATKISRIHSITLLAPQIRRLLLCQVLYPIIITFSTAFVFADALMHRQEPRPIGYEDFLQLAIAWVGAIAFGTLPSIRVEIYDLFTFWKRP
ncbi:hypothetical protein K438DRAFT_1960243 [Mycena galopus ATCC 62051]|nr:hypothetical protein K438DRAFT_1960243 [Mycena galopus ATCC 62051]